MQLHVLIIFPIVGALLLWFIIKIFDIGFDFLRFSMKAPEATTKSTAWAGFSTSTRVISILGVAYDVLFSASLDIFGIILNILFLTDKCTACRNKVKEYILKKTEKRCCCCKGIDLKTRSEQLNDKIEQLETNKKNIKADMKEYAINWL